VSRYVLRAASIATPAELVKDGFVVVDGPVIAEVGQGEAPTGAGPVIDLGEVTVAPGFVDVHVHGGGGAQVNCATRQEVEDAVRAMARFHATHGTTSLVATTVSDEPSALRVAVEGVAAVAAGDGRGRQNGHAPPPASAGDGDGDGSRTSPVPAAVLGSHLEGPWIAPSRAGAQSPAAIRPPSVAELEELLALGQGTVRMVTIAPELQGAKDLIVVARAAGVVVSIGHTDADFETAVSAFDTGARHATHLFNAMAPIHHRQPGPVAAALADNRVTLEIIADGVHIHPALIALVARLAPERLVLVTDAIGATGTAPGRHWLGPLEVLVSDGRAVLANQEETVAGSVLTMDRAVALTVQVAQVPLLTALRAASLHPADTLGETAKGRLRPGADADMVVLGRDLGLLATIIGGRVAADPGGVLSLIGAGEQRAPQ
jgi:N-acetylglucosamine-6-phosphate deacetylase